MDKETTLPLPKPHYDVSPTNIHAACADLHSNHGLDPADFDPVTRKAKASTFFSPASSAEVPSAILFPRTTEDVSAILRTCSARRIPLTAYSGGTGLNGTLSSPRGGICLDFKHMNAILALHEDDMDVVVQPAVGWQELNGFLEGKGLFWPVDPGPGARVGGMIAMGCSGTNAYRYGTVREWVVAVTVVLANGRVVRTRRRPRKSSAGYNLTQLIIGSEGTLGVVTEAVLKVTRLPEDIHVGLVTFGETREAIGAAIQVVNSKYKLEALEFVDASSMRALNKAGIARQKFEEVPTLFLKMAGTAGPVDDQIAIVRELCEKNGAIIIEFFGQKDDVDRIWHARKVVAASFAAMKQSEDDLFLSADAAVPISNMAALIEYSEKETANLGFFCSAIGHVGDGNVHTAIVCGKRFKEQGEEIIAKVQRRALALEGTITGEHGIGLKLRDALEEEVGTAGVDMMREIKLALDPRCILNPDKVVRLEAEDEVGGSLDRLKL